MKNTPNKISLLVMLSVLNLMLIAGYAFFFTDLRAASGRVSVIKNEIEAEITKEQQNKLLEGIIADTAVDRGQIKKYFIESDRLVEFIEMIESTGRESGAEITVNSVQVSDFPQGIASTTKEQLKLDLKVSGRWASVLGFIFKIENIPYAASVSEVNLQSAGKDSKVASQWNAQLVVNVLKHK